MQPLRNMHHRLVGPVAYILLLQALCIMLSAGWRTRAINIYFIYYLSNYALSVFSFGQVFANLLINCAFSAQKHFSGTVGCQAGLNFFNGGGGCQIMYVQSG
jgi:hypothetical protein